MEGAAGPENDGEVLGSTVGTESRVQRKTARRKNEHKKYLLAAIASTTGFTTLSAAGGAASGQIPYSEDFWVCRHRRSYRHGPVTSSNHLHPCCFRMAAAFGAMASCPWLWSKAKIRSSRSFNNTNCNRDGAFWSFRPRSRSRGRRQGDWISEVEFPYTRGVSGED